MKLDYIVWGTLLAAATSSALAQQNNGSPLTGRIETVFVRESRDLFVEKKLVHTSTNKELWAAVRVENPLRNKYVTELAQLPQNITVERGDLVETLITEATLLGVAQPNAYAFSGALTQLPDVNRVTALVAKRDTLRAMLFGLNNSRPTPSLVFAAQACADKPTELAYSGLNTGPAIAQ